MIKIPKRLNLPCCNIPSLWMKIGKKKNKNRKFSRAVPYSELLGTKSAENRIFFFPKECVTISLVFLCPKR